MFGWYHAKHFCQLYSHYTRLRWDATRAVELWKISVAGRRSKGARSGNPPARSPGCTFFLKRLTTIFFSCRHQNTGRQRRFTVKIKQIKRSNMVTFLFSVHTITETKPYAGLGKAEPGLEPGRWIFQPAMRKLSVRLSVWQTRGLSQNERKLCPPTYTTWKNVYPSFGNKNNVW